MDFANRLEKLPEYVIADIEEYASRLIEQGKDLIRLDVGDPDFDTPEFIKEAASKALMEHGMNSYSPYRGIRELREKIAEEIKEHHGVDVDPEKEILITPGSKHAIFSTLLASVNKGDKVLIGDPVYPMFRNVSLFCGGIPKALPLREELDYSIDPAELNDESKIAVLNFPNNPTGGVIERKELDEIAENTKGKLVLYDSAYEKIVYDGYKAPFPWECPELRENTAILGSFSKTYCMTGWRVGYIVAKKEILDKILEVEKISNSCAPMFLQKACVTALEQGEESIKKMNEEYRRRRDALSDGLRKIGLKANKPKGAFYVYANVKEYGDSKELAKKLIDNGVTCVPGIGFGPTGEGYVRFALTESVERIEMAVERIKEALA